ncbi:MAG TPA: helix-turn-helix domain-containing protein [Cyclobacteriaceae bacterium]|nr:helix-turn-helix domain-containing protein [Cyclobacteriaceae bacterium]HMV08133.1 helix-turn-helix domain-containing protein [Cyclobacteriaceae bacterium]HMV88347.1 helix-turn-helix domain-containing protein [Cyclobacteriaceae bacterium]HMX00774.1 helix-turn-helix domain-containing protein [Cyclobacteriaceae bacterium]HMX49351.1 helix-turn-helix domain-containing protein [Cyclobacteriaceae bacterium]
MEKNERSKIYREQLATIEDLQGLEERLLDKIKVLLDQIANATTQKKKWLKSGEVKKLLGISNGTLFTLRLNGKLSPNKIGGTLYFSYDEIAKLMETKSEDF